MTRLRDTLQALRGAGFEAFEHCDLWIIRGKHWGARLDQEGRCWQVSARRPLRSGAALAAARQELETLEAALEFAPGGQA